MSKRKTVLETIQAGPATLAEIVKAVETVYGPWSNRKATCVIQGLRHGKPIIFDRAHEKYIWGPDFAGRGILPLLTKAEIVGASKDGIDLDLLLFVGGYSNS